MYTLEQGTNSPANEAAAVEIERRTRGRYCPVLLQVSGENVYTLHRSLTQPHLSQALDIFLADTVMPCAGGSSSTGYFANLVDMVESTSRPDALPLALDAVALASFSNRVYNPEIRLEAMQRYTSSVRQLRKAYLNIRTDALSLVACIVLLSIYEVLLHLSNVQSFPLILYLCCVQIIRADGTSDLNWLKHLHGLLAVMRRSVESNQMAPTAITMLVLGSWPSSHAEPSCKAIPNEFANGNSGSLLIPPSPSGMSLDPKMDRFKDLCLILPKVQSLFKNSSALLEPNSIRYESLLRRYRDDATLIRAEMLAWSATLPETFRPKALERFTQPYVLRFSTFEDLLCLSYRADDYLDYYTACMWSSYRQCLLHLINLLYHMNYALSKNPEAYDNSRDCAKIRNEAQHLVEDTCASIPFLLMGSVIRGNKPCGSIWQQNRPPMLIGALGLQWSLFAISILQIVPMAVREQMKASLLWIGKSLGIGQATILAQMDRNLPGGITAKGDALRWTGFLL